MEKHAKSKRTVYCRNGIRSQHSFNIGLRRLSLNSSAHRSKTGPAWDGPYNSNSDTLLHMACPDYVNIIKYLVSCDLYPHNKI